MCKAVTIPETGGHVRRNAHFPYTLGAYVLITPNQDALQIDLAPIFSLPRFEAFAIIQNIHYSLCDPSYVEVELLDDSMPNAEKMIKIPPEMYSIDLLNYPIFASGEHQRQVLKALRAIQDICDILEQEPKKSPRDPASNVSQCAGELLNQVRDFPHLLPPKTPDIYRNHWKWDEQRAVDFCNQLFDPVLKPPLRNIRKKSDELVFGLRASCSEIQKNLRLGELLEIANRK